MDRRAFILGTAGGLATVMVPARASARTLITTIESPPLSGQRREYFWGDSSRREFPLTFRPDRVIELALNGASVDISDPGSAWRVDLDRAVIMHADTEPPISRVDELTVIYNYSFPVVTTRIR